MKMRFVSAETTFSDWFCFDSPNCNFPSDMRFVRAHNIRAWFLKWVFK